MEGMEKVKNSRIIITGGTGFIGSHIVEQLINQGATVCVIDIQVLEKSYFVQKDLEKKVRLELVDIAKKNKINNIFSSFQPDYVFHLAAEAIVNDSYNNPFKTFQTNVMGTVSVLEAARATGSIKGIIVASSDKAYGKTKKAYVESSPLQGDHPYDVSKSATDLIAQTYFKTYNLPVVVTRFGNVYGEGDLHLDRIIPGICESILKKTTLQIRSNGKFVRDYLYVKDVADGYIFLIEKLDKTKGEAYNFSSADCYSVLALIEKAEEIFHTKIKYSIINNAINEIPYQHLNDSKIRSLGWKNSTPIEEGLQQTFNWYKSLFKQRLRY